MLPVLNNLLENREMTLDDGRFLMESSRYDKLVSAPDGTVRVHPGFRVIALTVPVPPYPGNPIDPPLRSDIAPETRWADKCTSDLGSKVVL